MKDAKKLERFKRWVHVFSTPEGQAVLDDMLKMCNYEETVIHVDNNGRVDPLALAVWNGKRAFFTEIKRNLIEPADMPESQEDEY